jgi:uncharacterized protein (TIGR03067 family)
LFEAKGESIFNRQLAPAIRVRRGPYVFGAGQLRNKFRFTGGGPLMKRLMYVWRCFMFAFPLLLLLLVGAELHGQGKQDEATREELKKEVAVLKELLRWQGAYQTDDGHSLTVTGDRWTTKSSGGEVYSGKIKILEVREKLTVADLLVEEGPTKGKTIKAIHRVDGDTLHYCGTYDLERPTEFKSGDGAPQYYAWKRIKK